jgi:hypothetical protein
MTLASPMCELRWRWPAQGLQRRLRLRLRESERAVPGRLVLWRAFPMQSHSLLIKECAVCIGLLHPLKRRERRRPERGELRLTASRRLRAASDEPHANRIDAEAAGLG